jgi:predicted Rossmann-fold nucleotide-binding protein
MVDILQDTQPAFLSGNDAETHLSFTYDHFHERKYIQLMADEGRFLVFINGGFTAEIELMETEWEITSGDALAPELESEILRRIKSYTS